MDSLLFVPLSSLFVLRCLLFVVCCSLFVVCCLWFVVYCVLFVVCYLMLVVWCFRVFGDLSSLFLFYVLSVVRCYLRVAMC